MFGYILSKISPTYATSVPGTEGVRSIWVVYWFWTKIFLLGSGPEE